jgi:hypothetical protein
MTIQAPHKIDTSSAQYAEVRAYMLAHGAPTIRACDVGGAWVAIEGSHRLAVAAELGITPDIDAMDYDSDVRVEHDLDDVPAGATTADIIAYLTSGEAGPCYSF